MLVGGAVGHLGILIRYMSPVSAPDSRPIQTYQLSPIGCYLMSTQFMEGLLLYSLREDSALQVPLNGDQMVHSPNAF